MKYLRPCLPSWIRRAGPVALLAALLIGSSLFCSACSSTNSDSDSTTRALEDPMGYKPNMDDEKVTSGGIGDFDKKGFDQDVNDVFK